MYSGLRSSTGQDKTIAELTAAGKSGLTSAIADIRTQVNKLENGDYVATASVDAKVKDSISGMLATADGTTAAGQFFSNVGAALTAGLITEANLSTKAASAGLMASNDFTAASILAQVNGDTSNVKIKADKIELDGSVIAQRLTAAQATISNITVNNADVSGTLVATNGSSNSVSINGNGFEAKWGDEGLKVGASGIQRWDATRNVWSPMYEKKICYVSKTSTVNLGDSEHKGVNYLLNANVLPDGQYS